MRDQSLDILRCIALICIIVIHIEPSSLWIRELRNFDVPLMVFLSGISYSLSKAREKPYLEYVASRFTRLIVPTWIFLCLFFVIRIIRDGTTPDYKTTIKYFLLLNNWYTWIIRVLFHIAILAPLVIPLANRIRGRLGWCVIIGAIIINEIIAITACKGYNGFDYQVILAMILPYVLVFLIGTMINEFPERVAGKTGLYLLTAFLVYLVLYYFLRGTIPLLSLYKYPPRFYWLTYGLAWSLILWRFKNSISNLFKKVHLASFASFVGSHTLWIYFWHILLITDLLPFFNINISLLRFALVFFPAVSITYIQSVIIRSLAQKMPTYLGRQLLIVFNG